MLFVYHVLESPRVSEFRSPRLPRPRVPESPRPHVPESPRPRVPTSQRPHVPESPRPQVPRPRPTFSNSPRQTIMTRWTDKQTYEVHKRDPTPALQRKFNSKLLQLKKADAIDIRRYNRMRCPVPQPAKLYGLPKLHKPNVPMRPIVSFCGSPTYELSKYLTTILKPLTDESRHKLQSTENFIDAIKTVQVPDDHN